MTPAKARKYLYSGTISVALFGTAAVYLNFEGAKCITMLSGAEVPVMSGRELEQATANCFVITNSYVYSLFGLVAGMILVTVWAVNRSQTLRVE